jgi:hypothetical protein
VKGSLPFTFHFSPFTSFSPLPPSRVGRYGFAAVTGFGAQNFGSRATHSAEG